MTAIVGILNKQAIAIAADSAVTVGGGQKIYNNANKIFTLSKHHPVGIAIYNNASFNSIVPWEIVIKMYRNQVKDKKFDSLKEYALDFYSYLDTYKNFYLKDDDMNRILSSEVIAYWSFIWESNPHILNSDVELSKYLDSQIKKYIKADNQVNGLTMSAFSKAIALALHIIKGDIEKSKLNYAGHENKIIELLYYVFTKRCVNHPEYSGLAFFGYGDKDIFPSLYRTKIYSSVAGHLRWDEDTFEKVEESGQDAYICPMAQKDDILSYVTGVTPKMEDTFFDTTLTAITDVINGLSKIVSTKDIKLAEMIKGIDLRPVIENYKNNIAKIKQEQMVSPLITTVSSMGKEDLAELAENLIYLTSLKRHITPNLESVGGPVDVAVVSKGDGFIWIKRKHYFEPELNKPFFENYLNK